MHKRLVEAVIDCTVYPPRRYLDWAFVDAPGWGCLAADDSSNRGLLIYDEECPAPPYSERWGHEAKCLAQPYSEKWKQVDFAQLYSEMCYKRLTKAVIDCTVYSPRRCLDWAFVDAPRGGVWQSMTAWLMRSKTLFREMDLGD